MAVSTNPQLLALLTRLHSKHERQEKSIQRLLFKVKFTLYCLRNWRYQELWNSYCDDHCKDQLLSHDKDKCEFLYMLARMNGAQSIIECGTSFGVSTIYLALAARDNAPKVGEPTFGVLTLEKDATKAEAARKVWKEGGSEVADWIECREGDLLESLVDEKSLPAVVDFLFLDAWASLALPALRLVTPRLRDGSVVVVDRTKAARNLYADLLGFVYDPENGFTSMTLPFSQGLEVMVYRASEWRKAPLSTAT